jgi:hypothetical protein
MTKTLSSILSVFFLLTVSSFVLNAQEVGTPSFEAHEPDPIRERGIISVPPNEATDPPRSQSNPTLTKDSTSSAPAMHRNVFKPSPVVPKQENKADADSNDDSILSFNFLYYLIQKYKMQDIMD